MLNYDSNTAWLDYDTIVEDVLSELNLDQRHYARILSLVVRGFQEVYTGTLPSVKTVLLPFSNPNVRVIDFPFDYSYYTKIGIICAYGPSATPVLMTLSRNERLRLITPEEVAAANCTCEESTDITTNLENLAAGLMPFSEYTIFNNVIRNNQVVGEMFGAGSGMSTHGSYREDTENFRFVFSNEVPIDSLIALEYKSTGLESGSNVRIPAMAREALIAFGKWKALDNPKTSGYDRRVYKEQWIEARKMLLKRISALSMSEILDVIERSGKILKV